MYYSVSDDDVGNYEASLFMFSNADMEPEGIRMSLNVGAGKTESEGMIRRAGHHLDGSGVMSKIPGCCGMLRSRFTMVTNWATFAKDIAWPEGTHEEVHLPLEMFVGWNGAILFRPSNGNIAAIVYSNDTDDTFLTTNGPFRDLQNESWAGIFP